MKAMFLLMCFFVFQFHAQAANKYPHLTLEYSYGIDTYCPQKLDPEVLPEWMTNLIPRIPVYRSELMKKLPHFQKEWDKVEPYFLGTTVSEIGVPFQRKDFSVSLFLCPRFPSMGSPLMINIMSYLESPVRDIPTMEKPLPAFLFQSILFHEILHKYINDILRDHPSKILANLPREFFEDMPKPELVIAHLHLFALQKLVYEKLNQGHLLKWIKIQEDGHGKEYTRAWEIVHEKGYADPLIDELKAAGLSR